MEAAPNVACVGSLSGIAYGDGQLVAVGSVAFVLCLRQASANARIMSKNILAVRTGLFIAALLTACSNHKDAVTNAAKRLAVGSLSFGRTSRLLREL